METDLRNQLIQMGDTLKSLAEKVQPKDAAVLMAAIAGITSIVNVIKITIESISSNK